MAGFKDLMFTGIIIALFLIALVNFGVNFAQENDMNSTLLDDPAISKAFYNLSLGIDSSFNTTNSTRTSFEKDSITTSSDNLVISAVKGVGTTFGGTISAFFSIIFNLVGSVLGIPKVVLVAIATMITVSIVLLAWRLYRAGE